MAPKRLVAIPGIDVEKMLVAFNKDKTKEHNALMVLTPLLHDPFNQLSNHFMYLLVCHIFSTGNSIGYCNNVCGIFCIYPDSSIRTHSTFKREVFPKEGK